MARLLISPLLLLLLLLGCTYIRRAPLSSFTLVSERVRPNTEAVAFNLTRSQCERPAGLAALARVDVLECARGHDVRSL
ncbi:MAG: hypothetical protein GY937_07835 [bacterium]|nr:hypothetical protein [bacterium]